MFCGCLGCFGFLCLYVCSAPPLPSRSLFLHTCPQLTHQAITVLRHKPCTNSWIIVLFTVCFCVKLYCLFACLPLTFTPVLPVCRTISLPTARFGKPASQLSFWDTLRVSVSAFAAMLAVMHNIAFG